MGNNVIYNDNDECIGYFEDLVALYKGMMKNEIDLDDMDEVQHLAEELTELYKLEDYDGLIVLSENNGMGFTARKYEQVMKGKTMTSEIDLLASFVADLEHIKANETNEEIKETLREVINYLNNKSYELERE